jgi:hypothetical protein
MLAVYYFLQKKGCLGKRQPGNKFKKGIRESKGNFGKSNHFILNSFKRTWFIKMVLSIKPEQINLQNISLRLMAG